MKKLVSWDEGDSSLPDVVEAHIASQIMAGGGVTSGAVDTKIVTERGTERAYQSSTFGRFPSAGERLRRAAAEAGDAALAGVVMTSPPTHTVSVVGTGDATLTRHYQTPHAAFLVTGGTAFQTDILANLMSAWSVSMPGGTGGNAAYMNAPVAKQTYWFAIEFMTDAPKVEFMQQDPKFQVEVDGQPIAAAEFSHSGGGDNWDLLDFTAVGGSKARHIRLLFGAGGGVYKVSVGPTYSLWRPQSATNLRVALVGDSIACGVGATTQTAGWIAYAAGLLGWTDFRQVAHGGTGFVVSAGLNTFGSALRVADTVAADPDLLVIQASGNDDSQAGIQAAAEAAFAAYRTALPLVPIVVVGCDSASSGPSAPRLATEAAVLAGFTAWADPNSWWIPDCADPSPWQFGTGIASAPDTTGNRDWYGYDGGHPNDLGHAHIARRFAAAFKALVLPNVH